MRAKFWAYATALVVSAAVVGLGGRGLTGISPADCKIPPSPDLFVAFCGSKAFGNYEHAAFWYGMEPDAVSNLRRADVLFTGSSQVMFAFSTEAVRQFFADRGLNYFLVGFGDREEDLFFLDLVAKYHLHPKVIVVGANPYFEERRSFSAHDVERRYVYWRVRAWALRFAIEAKASLCGRGIVKCSGGSTLFRSSRNGRWVWRDALLPDDQHPRVKWRGSPYKDDEVEAIRDSAKRFVSSVGIESSCIVVVPLPDGNDWDGQNPIKEIAVGLGMVYVDPNPPSLTTVDGVHLSYGSAEQYSAIVMSEISRTVLRCTGQKPSPGIGSQANGAP